MMHEHTFVKHVRRTKRRELWTRFNFANSLQRVKPGHYITTLYSCVECDAQGYPIGSLR